MKVNESLKIKALIDLEPSSSRSRRSPKIESLFHSSHKKTRSESSASITPKHTAGVFSTFHSTNKPPNFKTDRLPTNTVSNAPSRGHTRQNSQRDNKENIGIIKERISYGSKLRQTKIFKLKQQFQRTLKKKHAFRRHTTITQQDVSLVLNEMGIMKWTNKYFKEFLESIIEMLQVGYTQLLAVNFFLVILALLNIHLSKKQLNTMVLGSYDKDKDKVMEFDQVQVNKIAETYEEIIGKSSVKQTSHWTSRCIQINVTLPDNRKGEITFRKSEEYQQIAQRIMSKYAIPGQKLRNIENIIHSKLKQKQ